MTQSHLVAAMIVVVLLLALAPAGMAQDSGDFGLSPGDFAAYDAELLDGAQELRLRLQQVFVNQPDVK